VCDAKKKWCNSDKYDLRGKRCKNNTFHLNASTTYVVSMLVFTKEMITVCTQPERGLGLKSTFSTVVAATHLKLISNRSCDIASVREHVPGNTCARVHNARNKNKINITYGRCGIHKTFLCLTQYFGSSDGRWRGARNSDQPLVYNGNNDSKTRHDPEVFVKQTVARSVIVSG
jgi:hypothetical protein